MCNTGDLAVVCSYGPHFGEEQPLVGSGGSGTIFFGHCNLHCVFCQNYGTSHFPEGEGGLEASPSQLANVMLELQNRGCVNINFVTPSHVVGQILEALPEAIDRGLHLPLVYNTSGYDRLETLRLLDGIIDIYLPDFKFFSSKLARRYLKAPDYPRQARRAIREMYNQVGDIYLGENGTVDRGLMVRHLVMPGQVEDSENIIRWIAEELSKTIYLNLMDQYRPCGRAADFSEINHTLSSAEYRLVREAAVKHGLTNLDHRDLATLLNRMGGFD